MVIAVGSSSTTAIAAAARNDLQRCRRAAEELLKRRRRKMEISSSSSHPMLPAATLSAEAEAEAEAEENASMCERILADLEAIFRREEANILDFDIIGLADHSTTNKSPVVYVDRHLALERWAVPHLYAFACRKVLHARSHFHHHHHHHSSSSHLCFTNGVIGGGGGGGGGGTSSTADLHSVHQCTRILLLINPDLTTAWNLRREMIKCRLLTHHSPADELRFTQLVLGRKPKCASVFTYREWLLNGLLSSAAQNSEDLEEEEEEGEETHLEAAVDRLLVTELAVTLDAAGRYARNYYAWSHRTWLFTVFLDQPQQQQQQRATTSRPFSKRFILTKVHHDLEVTARWLEAHISDYSCFQHRQSLLQYLFSAEERKRKRQQQQQQQKPNSSTSELSSSSSSALPQSSPQPPPPPPHLPTFFEAFQREFTLLESLFPLYPAQESLLLHRRALLKAAVGVGGGGGGWCQGDQEKVEALRRREEAFHRDHLGPAVTVLLQRQRTGQSPEAEATLGNGLWEAELLRRYQAYLRRNLNWSFD